MQPGSWQWHYSGCSLQARLQPAKLVVQQKMSVSYGTSRIANALFLSPIRLSGTLPVEHWDLDISIGSFRWPLKTWLLSKYYYIKSDISKELEVKRVWVVTVVSNDKSMCLLCHQYCIVTVVYIELCWCLPSFQVSLKLLLILNTKNHFQRLIQVGCMQCLYW